MTKTYLPIYEKSSYTADSVIITCYNYESFVEPCLQSVIGSNYPNLEIIFVDDGSTDKSFCIAKDLVVKSGVSAQVWLYLDIYLEKAGTRAAGLKRCNGNV